MGFNHLFNLFLQRQNYSMPKADKLDFDSFLSYFPELEPPLTVSNDSIKEISQRNKVLPLEIVQEYFTRWEQDIDEFTEFIPCFSLPREENFYGLVYWKGGLLNHQFILLTLDSKNQVLIAQKVIAGTISDGETVVQSVATISEDNTIQIMVGKMLTDTINPLDNQSYYMEILPNGEIMSQKEDKPLSWLKDENQHSKAKK